MTASLSVPMNICHSQLPQPHTLSSDIPVELPYELTVVPVSCKSLRDGSMRVEHIIVVPHEGVKKIVVGSHGAALKHVGTSARMELQRMWGHKVHLILTVKVGK